MPGSSYMGKEYLGSKSIKEEKEKSTLHCDHEFGIDLHDPGVFWKKYGRHDTIG